MKNPTKLLTLLSEEYEQRFIVAQATNVSSQDQIWGTGRNVESVILLAHLEMQIRKDTKNARGIVLAACQPQD